MDWWVSSVGRFSAGVLLDIMPEADREKMPEDEIRFAKTWYGKDKIPPSEIAARLGRDKSALTRLLVRQAPRKKQGAPPKLTEAKIDFLVKRLHELIVKADCKYSVTVNMLKRSARVKASEKRSERRCVTATYTSASCARSRL